MNEYSIDIPGYYVNNDKILCGKYVTNVVVDDQNNATDITVKYFSDYDSADIFESGFSITADDIHMFFNTPKLYDQKMNELFKQCDFPNTVILRCADEANDATITT